MDRALEIGKWRRIYLNYGLVHTLRITLFISPIQPHLNVIAISQHANKVDMAIT